MAKYVWYSALLLLVLTACAQPRDIEPSQAKEMLNNKERLGLFVLNVHTPYEGKLEKTDAIIEDWGNVAAHQDQLPKDKNAPILVYCRTGRMSSSAVKQLKELGYSNIYHLKGGMKAYDAAGYEVMEKSWK